jgi:P-type Ca2+ transporter type 2C
MADIFDLRNIQGLSETEANKRLQEEGRNELPSSKPRGFFTIALDVLHEPMFLLLVAAGCLYLFLGEPSDALMLLGFVFVVMGITIYQERRTEHALEALRDLSSPRALVIRDGMQKRIAGREVARGDTIVLAEGDRVPADGVLRYSINLCTDESLLTGESVPVRKTFCEGDVTQQRPGGDGLPLVFSGSLVTNGQGVAEVLATGQKTELGKIGKALQTIKTEQTLLQKETGHAVRIFAIIGLVLCSIVIVVYGLTRGNTSQSWGQGLLAGIAMAMSILPEEFPVILTIFLALGAWRISRNHVLTRRMPAVETLGAATVLCTDKTGTLTLNQMAVRQLHVEGSTFDTKDQDTGTLPEKFHEILEYGVLASKRNPFDPMEKALMHLGQKYLADTEHLHERWSLVREYPLSQMMLALSHVWHSTEDGGKYIVATKGAPEAIADLCHMDNTKTKQLSQQVAKMANQGLRVLGVARAYLPREKLPEQQHDISFEFLGLIGLTDPIRPTVPAAIQECYTAGIRVIMITGDYAGTAKNIAEQIGLSNPDNIITGSELDMMSDEALAERIRKVNIFARVVPEQKLRIVNALKANNEIVAMTGDGVNDAPALKAAHIGIAMGGRGTDVARETSSIVLLDDDFSSIVKAVRMGRRIYDNIKKAICYTIAVHVPIAGLSMIPVFSRELPLLLLPVHIVFLELIIDPACSIVFEMENEEKDIMLRPPRDPKERLFNKNSFALSFLQGFIVLAISLGVFWISRIIGHPQDDSRRAFVFSTLVIANLCLILTNRSWSRTILSMFKERNPALWWVVGGALSVLVLVLNVPVLSNQFHFKSLSIEDSLLCVAAGIISILWFETVKVLRASKR